MTESFAYLGLHADADEHAVKRAYAQRLKQTRPEDDPEGFQTLHDHYRLALNHARWHAETAQTASTSPEPEQHETVVPDIAQAAATTASPSAASAPPPIAAQPVFDADAFLQTLLARIGDGDAGKLRDWLQSIDAFWSLAVKHHAGYIVLQKLEKDRPAMGSESFNAILAFFALDDALNGHDHFAIVRLRNTLQVRYELLDEQHNELVARMQHTAKFQPSQTRRLIAILLRPYVRWRSYASALLPGRPTSMVYFIQTLSHGQPDLLCPPIDSQHLKFWFAAADRERCIRPRVLLGYLRNVVLTISAAAIVCALTLLAPLSPPQRFDLVLDILNFFARAFVLLNVLWTAWLIWLAMLHWQIGAEDGRLDRNGMGRLLFVPAVAAAAAAACFYAVRVWQLNAGLTVAAVIALLAVLRFWRRAGLRFSTIQFVMAVGSLAGVALVSIILMLYVKNFRTVNALFGNDERQARAFIGIVLTVVAGLAWVMDLVRQRHRFYRPAAKDRR